MIDIHTHILPGIDDGSRNWDESLLMAKKAVDNGIDKIIATPHHQNGIYLNEANKVITLVREFNQLLHNEHIPLTIYPGSETQMYAGFINDLKEERFFTINAKRYVLLELPYNEVPRFAEQLIYDIQLAGYTPIIPHPERNKDIRNNPIKIYQLVKRGALTQITSSSLLGLFGKDIQKFAFELIECNLTHLLATDAHKPDGNRGFNLNEGYHMLDTFGGSILVQQFKRNVENVFHGREIYVEVPVRITKKKFFGII